MYPPTVPPAPTTRRLKRFAPLQLGKIMGILYAIFGLLFLPVFLIVSVIGSQMPAEHRVGMMAMGAGFALFMPIIYGVMGFVGGVLCAWLYNLIARWIGGIEVEVE